VVSVYVLSVAGSMLYATWGISLCAYRIRTLLYGRGITPGALLCSGWGTLLSPCSTPTLLLRTCIFFDWSEGGVSPPFGSIR